MARVLPWLVAAAILYLLFRKYPPAEVASASRDIRWVPFLSFSLGYFAFMWFWDCLSYSRVLGRLGFRTKARQLAGLRATAYLAALLSPVAGEGAYTYFLKRRLGIPLQRGLRLVLLVISADIYWTSTIAFAGTYFFRPHATVANLDLAPFIRWTWLAVTIIMVLLCCLPKMRFHPTDVIVALVLRLPMHLALNTSLYVLALTFGARLPLLQTLAYCPIEVLVGALPITPGGLGTTQAATIALFRSSLPGEMLLSMTLAFTFVNYVLKATAGLVFLRGHLREVTNIPPPSL